MKLALILPALISFAFISSTDDCSSFYPQVVSECEALSSGTTKCIYSGNQCLSSYNECTDYAPTTGFDEATCTRIIPTDPKKKCIVKTETSGKTCISESKKCSDHTSNDDCINLEAGEGQRCLLVENQRCEAHYNECSQLTSQGETKCVANIPNDKTKMCSWSNGACAETDRTCEKYIFYSDQTGTSETCFNLHATDPKKCIFENSKTYRQEYEKCENGNGDENLCKTIRPLNALKTGYDQFSECILDSDNSCKQKKNLVINL